MKRLKQAWKRDRLGVMGVGSAVVAFVLWAFPIRAYGVCVYQDFQIQLDTCVLTPMTGLDYFSTWRLMQPRGIAYTDIESYAFTMDRLPAIGAFLVLAVILLLLRRR